MLVLTTLLVFATGVWLLLLGHKAGAVLEAHKVAFIVWSVVFGVHFLVHTPRVLRGCGGSKCRASASALPWSPPRSEPASRSRCRCYR